MGHKVKQSLVNSRIDFFYYAFRSILLVGVPLVIISALILGLTTSHSSADTASSDDITLKLDVACTVSSVVTSPHSALDMNVGQYKTDIGNTDISVFCNDNNGYSVYAIGNSNSTDGNSDLISNINENYNIHTGINTTGNSSWSMKLTAGTGTSSEITPPSIVNGYNSYSLIPNNYTLVATRPSGTSMNPDTSASGSYFSTTYAIYAASTQPAGTYNGKVKYVMVHPDNSTHNTIPDIEAAFAMAGKRKTYQDTGGNYYYSMQDMDNTICASVDRKGIATATQLVDMRDNNLYWVAKLDDGNCWMTSNLDLDIGGTNVAALTSENTDISTTASGSGIYLSGYTEQDGVWTWNPVSTAITSNYYIDNITVKPSAWPTDNYTTPYSAEGGDTYYYTSNTTGNDTRYNSLQACKDASHTEDECKRYFAGNYYNWSAAIASNNSTNIGSTVGDIAANSICPKGWRLPNASQTSNEYNEFGIMLYKAGITSNLSAGNESAGYKDGVTSFNKLRSNPYYFVRSGGIYGSTLSNPSIFGGYWSSTDSNSTHAYNLNFGGTGIYPARDLDRYYGRSVRCVAR